ncbi:MAG: O-antigen ligase family protein [Holophaga sp.]|nr:O-antigen ligase family protein [Holophaga sp.]
MAADPMTLPSSLPVLSAFDRLDLRSQVLTGILCVMLGGVFPAFVLLLGHTADLAVWILTWVLLASFWLERPLLRLLLPAAPLLAWVACYIAWGVMAADYAIFDEGYRLAFRFGTVAAAMAVVTSRPERLRRFANAMQWVLLLNLAVTVLLMTRPEYQSNPLFATLQVDVESDRFAGMWGNANQAGLVSLMVLVLSHWAAPLRARMGQACGLLIIYLTASRTATWISVTLAVVYLLFGASRRFRLNALLAVLVLGTGALFALRVGGTSLASAVRNNPTLSRVLDVSESRTEKAGQGSRMQVLKDWLRLVPAEPWYGYGLYTLYGGESTESVKRPGFPVYGPHNLYLGIFLDVGGAGLLAFLAVVGFQLGRIRRAPLLPPARRVLLAFGFIILVFSNFNHNMLTDYAGWIAYSLLFLLPDCPALAPERLGLEQPPAGDWR